MVHAEFKVHLDKGYCTKMTRIINDNEEELISGEGENIFYMKEDIIPDNKYDERGIYYMWDNDNDTIIQMFGAPYGIGPSVRIRCMDDENLNEQNIDSKIWKLFQDVLQQQ